MNNFIATNIRDTASYQTVFELRNIYTTTTTSSNMNGLNYELRRREVHAIVGARTFAIQNIMRVLTDDIPLAKGEILLNGKPVTMRSMMRSQKDLCIINDQDYLYPDFSVFDNIYYYSREILNRSRKEKHKKCKELFEELNLNIDIDSKVSQLSMEQRKMVEVMRAFIWGPKVVIMHDVMPRLGRKYASIFPSLLGQWKNKGSSIAYITSLIDDAIAIADRISVLNHGILSNTFLIDEAKKNPMRLVGAVAGWETLSIADENEQDIVFTDIIAQARRMMNRNNELSQTLEFLNQNLCSIVNASNTIIYIISEDDNSIMHTSSQDNGESLLEKSFVQQVTSDGIELSFHQSKIPFNEGKKNDYQRLYCIPFPINSSTQGMIEILYEENRSLTEQDRNFIGTICDEIRLMIEMASIVDHSLLLQESHHRIKNNLQIIISFLYMQESKYLKETDEKSSRLVHTIIGTTVNRIRSIAAIHDLISRDRVGWNNINISWLIREIISFYDSSDITFRLDIDEINIPYKQATSFALIINELVNNCVEHAFPEKMQGKIITIICKTTQNSLSVSVRDNGTGISDDFDLQNDDGIGISVIRSIATEYNAEMHYKKENGTVVNLKIPLTELYKK